MLGTLRQAERLGRLRERPTSAVRQFGAALLDVMDDNRAGDERDLLLSAALMARSDVQPRTVLSHLFAIEEVEENEDEVTEEVSVEDVDLDDLHSGKYIIESDDEVTEESVMEDMMAMAALAQGVPGRVSVPAEDEGSFDPSSISWQDNVDPEWG